MRSLILVPPDRRTPCGGLRSRLRELPAELSQRFRTAVFVSDQIMPAGHGG